MKNVRTLILTLLPGLLLAHYTWVSPVTLPLEVGKTAAVRISHGHKFPQSEEAINASQVQLYAVAPSGAKSILVAQRGAGMVNSEYAVKEAGLHRLVMVQDRGVMSRTPKGARPGGRQKNPDAVQASRTFRTAIAYTGTAGAKPVAPKPLGLEIEITGERSADGWRLQLLKNGAPMSGVEIQVFLQGAATAAPLGRTSAEGRVEYRAAKGPLLFVVEHKDKAPAGADYDNVNYETSLFVNW
jgi:uncharacterized GH25 family protein